MKNKITIFASIVSLVLAFSLLSPTQLAFRSDGGEKLYTVAAVSYENAQNAAAYEQGGAQSDGGVEVGSRLLELIFGGGKKNKSYKDIKLCPGGDAFGVKICGSGVTVTKVITELSSGVLKPDDRIISINKTTVFTTDEVKEIVNASGGKALSFEILRDGKTQIAEITPRCAGGEYHLGVILSDGASGIGTVTYYHPETYEFGGLGHGICSADGKEVLKMTRGQVTGVILAGASRGAPSKPGELRGVLTDRNLGTLYANTKMGVFGVLDSEAFSKTASEPIPIASRSDVTAGEATIISTVKNGKKCEYKIEISDIDHTSDGTKCFRIKVTDEALIALTGGIVRGMSGSPIIQNGKLVGAVTHVMVADPTEGYGIFIENMLNAAQGEALPKAA